MSRVIMERKAADNKYLHKDFHNHLNLGLEYLRLKFGEEAVREYLRQFAMAYYAPLKADIAKRGLEPILEHYKKIYYLEDALSEIEFSFNENELFIFVKKCPGVAHIIKSGLVPSPLYYELTKTVNDTICEGTGYGFKLMEYDQATGASKQYFYRKGDCE